VLFFRNWAPCHEGVLGERRYNSTYPLTSALDGGEWSASRPGRFIPREKAPGTHWVGGWVGPKAILDLVLKRIPSPRWESNSRTPIFHPVAYSLHRPSYHGSIQSITDIVKLQQWWIWSQLRRETLRKDMNPVLRSHLLVPVLHYTLCVWNI
jgi:hypothetical protein